jgi:hypothetical protein
MAKSKVRTREERERRANCEEGRGKEKKGQSTCGIKTKAIGLEIMLCFHFQQKIFAKPIHLEKFQAKSPGKKIHLTPTERTASLFLLFLCCAY